MLRVLRDSAKGMFERLLAWVGLIRRSPVCEGTLVVLAGAAVFWFVLGGLMTGDYVNDKGPDQTYWANPLFHFAAKCFASREYPYWAPSILGGAALYNSPQLSLSYPFYFLGGGGLESPLAAALHVTSVVFFHLFVFLLNMYVMLRALKVRPTPSFLGACLATFNPAFYCYVDWVSVVVPYSWLPLGLAGVFVILEDERPWTGMALAIAGSTLLTIASPSQPLIHLTYLAAVLSTAWLFLRFRKGQTVWRPARNLAIAVAAAVALSSPVLFPAYDMMQSAIRWVSAEDAIVGRQSIPFSVFTHDSWSLGELARLVFPITVEHSVGDIHLGILAMVLVGLSLFVVRSRPILIAFWALAIYALMSSTATRLGLAYINYRLPLLNLMREPGRHLIIAHLSLCVLAAFGFEHLCTYMRQKPLVGRKLHLAYFLLALAAVVALAAINRRPYVPAVTPAHVWLPVLVFAAAAILFWLRPRASVFVPLVLGAVVLWPATRQLPHLVPLERATSFEKGNLNLHDILKEVAAIPDVQSYRVGILDERHYQYWSMICLYYDLRTNSAYFSPAPHQQFVDVAHLQFRQRGKRLFGIKYLLVKNGAQPPSGYARHRQFDGYDLYVNTDAMPRYVLVNQIGAKYANREQFLKVEADRSCLTKVYVQEKDFHLVRGWLGNQAQPLNPKTREISRTYNALILWCSVEAPAMLVLNEYHDKAWQVFVDGRRETPLKVNQFQLGVLLPRGKHVIRFQYAPQRYLGLVRFQQGLLIAALAAVGLVVFVRVQSQWLGLFEASRSAQTARSCE